MLVKPNGYTELVEKHKLTFLKRGGDLSLDETGGLAMSKDGDIRLGSPAYDAAFRFVEGWRMNAPTMRLLFEASIELRAEENSHRRKIGPVLVEAGDRFERSGDYSDYHSARDREASAALGRWVLAGSLMVTAAALLSKLKSDADPTDAEWDQAPPLLGGVSIGQAIVSAAIIFRHRDEYVKQRYARTLGKRERKNMSALVAALSMTHESDLFGDRNPCEQLALLLGKEGFDDFEGAILQFGHDVTERVEDRS